MIRKIVTVVSMCTVFSLVSSITATDASSVNNGSEMAGMVAMLDEYYESQHENDTAISPEAVEPIAVSGAAEMIDNVVSMTQDENEQGVSGTVQDGSMQPDMIQPDAVQPDMAQPDAVQPDMAQPDAAQPVVTPEPVSEYANTGISIAHEYVNIRKKPNTESKILGKLYRGSAARIINTVGDWVEIKSGSVTGYIKSEYLAIGFSAENLIDRYGTKLATVNVTTLKVREERSTDSVVLTLVPEGEEFEVIKEYGEWVKIIVDDTTKGYVSKEYVNIRVKFKHAISIKEEREKIRRQKEREEAIRRAEEERQRQIEEEQRREAAERAAAQRAAEQRAAAQRSSSSSSSSKSSSSSNSSSSSKSSTSSSSSSRSSSSSSSSRSNSSGSSSSSKGTASSAASYAQNFIGNPYVLGGTSLTNGTDCSGFVQSVYSKYGVSLPRTSSSQSCAGSSVSLSDVQAGDLIFYASNGSVNHVAMYIGGGKVVHASNRRDGIKVSNMNYRTPCKARRVAN